MNNKAALRHEQRKAAKQAKLDEKKYRERKIQVHPVTDKLFARIPKVN